jgi:phosphohistidine phosphatase
MNLYLIRHGIAEDRSQYEQDDKRPLTDKGHQKTENVAKKLKQIGIKLDLILTSPLVRAKQTAEICQKVGLTEKIVEFSALSPGGELTVWVNWWHQSGYNNNENNLGLVGHQPDLANWAETLVWGKSQGKLLLKKAGIIGLRLPKQSENPLGKSELFLLTSPRWMLNKF